MPRSPSRRQSSYERGKRDYRHLEKKDEQQYYGAQSKKKVHRSGQYLERAREDSNQRRRVLFDDSRRKYESYDQPPVIHIKTKQIVKVKQTQPESQIKIHFRFRPLKIKLNSRAEQDLKKKLEYHLSAKIGPVSYFQKSIDSCSGYLVLELGFKFDNDALTFLDGKFSEFDVLVEKEKVFLSAEPTKTFRLLLNDYEQRKNRSSKHQMKEKSRSSSSRGRKEKSFQKKKKKASQSNSPSSHSSVSSDQNSQRKDNHKRHERDYHKHDGRDDRREKIRQNLTENLRQGKRDTIKDERRQSSFKHRQDSNYFSTNSNKNQSGLQKSATVQPLSKSEQEIKSQYKQQKTLFFFGVHYSVNSKDMDNLFRYHEQGPFLHQELIWRRIQNSISQFLEGRFDKKHALKLLQLADKLEVKGHPFVIIDSQSMEPEKILQKISQHQVSFLFPRLIQPYYLLKGMKECGRVVQIVSINMLSQQGRSQYYNVTFNSKQLCSKLKNIKKTSKEIIIEEVNPENAVFVFRPNSKTELMTVDYYQDNYKNNRSVDVPEYFRNRNMDEPIKDQNYESYERNKQR